MSVPPAGPGGPEPRREPRPRIGDAERDRAVGFLQEHMAQGRLDAGEFDERLTRALQARTEDDLAPLFDDLPEPRPGGLAPATGFSPPPWSATGAPAVAPIPSPVPAPTTAPQGPGTPRAVQLALTAIWPVAIVAFIASGWEFFWILVVAAVLSYYLKRSYPGPPAVEAKPEDPPRPLGR